MNFSRGFFRAMHINSAGLIFFFKFINKLKKKKKKKFMNKQPGKD